MRRNLRACSCRIKEHCFKTSVQLIIEYASTIWVPHTAQTSIKLKCYKGEVLNLSLANKYQRNIAKCHQITKYTLGWPLLKTRRYYLKIISTYKILKRIWLLYPQITSDNFRPINYGHQHHFQHLQCTCDSYKYSFFPSAIKLWNFFIAIAS